jgi:hypothetical protein
MNSLLEPPGISIAKGGACWVFSGAKYRTLRETPSPKTRDSSEAAANPARATRNRAWMRLRAFVMKYRPMHGSFMEIQVYEYINE